MNVAEIREAAAYWVFPVFQIWCCGVLVEKATGKLVELGSYTPLEDWIWGFEQGLLDKPALVEWHWSLPNVSPTPAQA